MTISLRQATASDRDFLWELHETTMKAFVQQTWGWDYQWQKEDFERQFVPQEIEVVQMGETAIGCLSVQREADHVFLSLIEIAPSHQNRGLGTELILQVIREAEGKPVLLRVLKRSPAKALYERLGFQHVQETESHHIMIRETSKTE